MIVWMFNSIPNWHYDLPHSSKTCSVQNWQKIPPPQPLGLSALGMSQVCANLHIVSNVHDKNYWNSSNGLLGDTRYVDG